MKNESWIDKVKYLTKNNYTFCQNKEYIFELTLNKNINNKQDFKKNEYINMISILIIIIWVLNPFLAVFLLWFGILSFLI
jgi:hypothetical protein